MNDAVNTTYWVAAAIILVLLVVGVALWYSAVESESYLSNFVDSCYDKGGVALEDDAGNPYCQISGVRNDARYELNIQEGDSVDKARIQI